MNNKIVLAFVIIICFSGCDSKKQCNETDELYFDNFIQRWNIEPNPKLRDTTFTLPNWDSSSSNTFRYSLDVQDLFLTIEQSSNCISSIKIDGSPRRTAVVFVLAVNRLFRILAPELKTSEVGKILFDEYEGDAQVGTTENGMISYKNEKVQYVVSPIGKTYRHLFAEVKPLNQDN